MKSSISDLDFIPFDIRCYTKLYERFQYLFEPALINEICASGQLYTFSEQHILMDIGETIHFMPLVVSGSIKILTEDQEGNDLLLYYLETGDTCAVTLNCCTTTAKSKIRAIVEQDCEVLFIPIVKLDEWMVKYPKWRAFILESYNVRLDEMLKAIDSLAFQNMEERLMKYLKDKVWITKSTDLTITHAEIANDLHSSRVVISRLMKKLENNQKIKQHRNRIEILNYTDW